MRQKVPVAIVLFSLLIATFATSAQFTPSEIEDMIEKRGEENVLC